MGILVEIFVFTFKIQHLTHILTIVLYTPIITKVCIDVVYR